VKVREGRREGKIEGRGKEWKKGRGKGRRKGKVWEVERTAPADMGGKSPTVGQRH
jgi:predicted transposase YdaD